MTYSIDTSSLIDASEIYPKDVFPSVWDFMEELISEARLKASQQVYVELSQKDDDVLEWADNNQKMFEEVDEDIQSIVKSLPDKDKLVDPNKFREDADPFVIALAIRDNAKVISQENWCQTPANKLKIPNVCNRVGIECLKLLSFLRDAGGNF